MTFEQFSRGVFSRAVAAGRIKRQPCSKCGAPNAHGHHPDYSRPLDVVWLCHRHHMELHAPLNRERRQARVEEIRRRIDAVDRKWRRKKRAKRALA